MRTGVDSDPLGEHFDAVAVASNDSCNDRGRRGVDGQDHGLTVCSTARSRSALRCPAAFEPDVEMAVRQPFGESFAPLHDDDRVVEIGVEIQRVQLGEQIDRPVIE